MNPDSSPSGGRISVVINTYNAQTYLNEILQYLKGYDEIVVCDMESTDHTVEIARANGCRVVVFPRGSHRFGDPARNFAIQSAENEWVLVVDADEIVPQELTEYLYRYIQRDDCCDALFIPRRNLLFDNRPSVAYPDYQCRLIRKSRCYWPPTVHSKPRIDGSVGYIDRRRTDLAMIHKPVTLRETFRKMCVYTDLELDRRISRHKRHISLMKFIASPSFRFFKTYILKGGIFHGRRGYIEARCDAIYRFMTLCKIYERQLSSSQTES